MILAGRSAFAWSAAGISASFPIPFIIPGQSALPYKTVPENIQGRIFEIHNGIQYYIIPINLLADYVFEPFMDYGYA